MYVQHFLFCRHKLISRNNYNGVKPFFVAVSSFIIGNGVYGYLWKRLHFFLSVALFACTLIFWFCPYFEKESIQTNFSPFLFLLSKTAMLLLLHTLDTTIPTLHNQSFKLFFLWLWDNDEQHSNVAEYLAVADFCCKQTFVCCKTTVNPTFPIELLKKPDLYWHIPHTLLWKMLNLEKELIQKIQPEDAVYMIHVSWGVWLSI